MEKATNVMICFIDKRWRIYFACDFNTRELGFRTGPNSELNHNLRIGWDVCHGKQSLEKLRWKTSSHKRVVSGSS